jgi:hypothetical protein
VQIVVGLSHQGRAICSSSSRTSHQVFCFTSGLFHEFNWDSAIGQGCTEAQSWSILVNEAQFLQLSLSVCRLKMHILFIIEEALIIHQNSRTCK